MKIGTTIVGYKSASKLGSVLIAVSLALVACENKKPEADEQPEPAATSSESGESGELEAKADAGVDETAKTDPSGNDAKEASAWKQTSSEELSAEEREMLERAKSAQKQLGGTLVKALTKAVAQDGFPAAVEVCNTAAPEIAQTVRQDTGVEIGRTSFRLRNPKNTPPAWAQPYVDQRVAEPTVLRGDAKLAYLAPIKMGDLCVNCHGPKDKLAEGVSEELARLYPKDQATGFKAGDLRGWFWVEVPES